MTCLQRVGDALAEHGVVVLGLCCRLDNRRPVELWRVLGHDRNLVPREDLVAGLSLVVQDLNLPLGQRLVEGLVVLLKRTQQ